MRSGQSIMRVPSSHPCRCIVPRSAFTLIEICVAVVIVGLGVAAAVQLIGATTKQTSAAVRLGVAANLANNICELLETASYQDPQYPNNWGLETGETLGASNKSLDVDDFSDPTKAIWGLDASPSGSPIDAGWQLISSLTINGKTQAALNRYTQKVIVEKLSKSDLSTVLASGVQDQGVRRITVEVWWQPTTSSPRTLEYRTKFLRFREK